MAAERTQGRQTTKGTDIEQGTRMTTKPRLATTVAAFCLIAASAGFAAGVHPVTGEALGDVQTFTYRELDDIPTIDPALIEDTSGNDVARNLFEGLMNQNAEGALVPGVATAFTVSPDNMTYTFTLRDTAKWSDGSAVVAGDFVYGWQRAVDPATASPYSWFLELANVVNASAIIAGEMTPDQLGVTAPDDHTLVVQLAQPTPYFAQMTTQSTLYPIPKAVIDEFGAEWTRPGNMVSNGAYQLSAAVPNERIEIVRNPNYWDNDHTILEKVTTLVINDENLALTRYQAGELEKTDIPLGQYPSLEEQMPDEATVVPHLCTYYYTLNLTETGNPALQDVRVRQALSYALDRDVIVDQVLKGGQYPAYNLTHVFTAGFTMPDIAYGKMSQTERDAKAKALLAEAGYGPDKPIDLTLIYNTSDAHKALATVVAQMEKQKLGVTITLSNFEWKTYLETRAQRKFDLARFAWCGDYNEASTFLDIMTTDNENNDGKFANAEYDRLLAEARTLADPQPNYTAAEQILADQMPILPLYQYTSNFVLKPDVKGWPYKNVQANWYAKDMYRVAQ